MELDNDILLRMIKSFVYNDINYNASNIISNGSIQNYIISNIQIIKYEFIGDNQVESWYIKGLIDMNGDQYVYGSGGFIKIVADINYESSARHTYQGKFTKEKDIFRIFYADYMAEVRNQKLSNMNIQISDKIKSSLDDYLEFDSFDIFNSCDLVRIFGGAIRDIIADMPIHDIDIMSASTSARKLDKLLLSNGYKYMELLNPKDLSSIYSDLEIISEPHTYMKGTKVVQVIRPRNSKSIQTLPVNERTSDSDKTYYANIMSDLISNVDISCCGVSYDGKNLFEDVKDAVLHCRSKLFEVNDYAKMKHEKRIHHRTYKLQDRGWTKIEKSNRIQMDRDKKINSIIDEYYNYIKTW